MRCPATPLMLFALATLPVPLTAQWHTVDVGTTTEFRSAWAPTDSVLWAGGRDGIVVRTTDAGSTWSADTIAGAQDLFFIGIWAADADTAVALGTGFQTSVARIYRTTDGGDTWTESWRDERDGIFLDALAFWDDGHGLAFGDPIDSAFVVLATDDGGTSWQQVPRDVLPPPLAGEAGFAASGRALVTAPGGHAWFGTGGGAQARVFHTPDYGATWHATVTPLASGASAGIFALAFRDSLDGYAVGGDHTQRAAASDNVLRTQDGGKTWVVAGSSLPAGVRYGATVAPVMADSADSAASAPPILIAVGPSGSGYSTDHGASWTVIDHQHWNTVSFGPGGAAWVLGMAGKVGRWVSEQ
ncbi:MAG: WD40/YVTN/BNR-like repeat-containing protein [Longimicrobiales bacterium]